MLKTNKYFCNPIWIISFPLAHHIAPRNLKELLFLFCTTQFIKISINLTNFAIHPRNGRKICHVLKSISLKGVLRHKLWNWFIVFHTTSWTARFRRLCPWGFNLIATQLQLGIESVGYWWAFTEDDERREEISYPLMATSKSLFSCGIWNGSWCIDRDFPGTRRKSRVWSDFREIFKGYRKSSPKELLFLLKWHISGLLRFHVRRFEIASAKLANINCHEGGDLIRNHGSGWCGASRQN